MSMMFPVLGSDWVGSVRQDQPDRGVFRSDRYGRWGTSTICRRRLATMPTSAENRAGKRCTGVFRSCKIWSRACRDVSGRRRVMR
jgi:hypothetical protein